LNRSEERIMMQKKYVNISRTALSPTQLKARIKGLQDCHMDIKRSISFLMAAENPTLDPLRPLPSAVGNIQPVAVLARTRQ
jgi:hypothetical protein